MLVKKIVCIVTLLLSQFHILTSQSNFDIAIALEASIGLNLGDITSSDKITDGYSDDSASQAIAFSISYKNIGIRLSKLNLDLNSAGFQKPFELIESTYDNFPRMWSGKGGTHSISGYQFTGYTIGLFKIFNTKYFDTKVLFDYAILDVNLSKSQPTNELYSYSYNTQNDFTARHWAFYNGGSFYKLGIELSKPIWKGITIYAGTHYRNGSFEYIYNEIIRDDLIPENNSDISSNQDKNFKSIGLNIGLQYGLSF